LRLAIGGLVLLPTLAFFARADLRFVASRPSTWLGGVTIYGNMFCYAAALAHLSPSEVNLLFQVNVVTSAVLGRWMYRETIPSRRWWALLTVLVGAACVILGRATHGATVEAATAGRALGVILGLGAGVFASGNQAFIRDTARRGLGLPAQVVMYVVACCLFAPSGGLPLAWSHAPDPHFWQVMIVLGVIGSGTASLLVAYALPRISLAQAGVTGTMQPVVTLAVATLLFGEHLTPPAAVGAALVIGGVLASALLEGEVRTLPATTEGLPAGGE
jgi:DME family drug/metabolite transporter